MLLMALPSRAAEKGLVAWWSFNEGRGRLAIDGASRAEDKISGNWWKYVPGSSGTGLKFDGFTTVVTRKAVAAPRLSGALTVEAWVAIAAYPWNWCPIVSQEKGERRGYYFGIDSAGHFGLQLAVNRKWRTCRSKIPLDLKKWHHVAGTYDAARGIVLYLNGSPSGRLSVQGEIDSANEADLLIGRNRTKRTPTHPVRTWATFPSWYAFDGILDEIKIYDRALTREEIRSAYAASSPKADPQIPPRVFPTGPDGPGRFGAFYANLKYYDEWDELWRTAGHPDVVVWFDEYPIRVVFWRGTRYSPAWVTENGKWMADQSLETSMNWGRSDGPTVGCDEHMSDRLCRFSHVRIIESHDARVVVHWRYALVDVLGRQAHVDPLTGWGDWGDEYYTIYPDGVAVRKVRYFTSGGGAGWQETIFLNEAGTKPEDNCELDAITLVNLEGQNRTYSWVQGYPRLDLEKPLIEMTNLKAKYRPFIIFRPGSEIEVFGTEVRPEFSHFPWWNHWPVAQIVSDGRYALAADRASSSSLAGAEPEGDAALYGMTADSAVSLLPLAKSWIAPPTLKVVAGTFISEGYDYGQRAYVLSSGSAGNPGSGAELELDASDQSPLVNPCFVLRNWGDVGATLKVNGQAVPRGKNYRLGHCQRLEGTDLIVWIKTQATKPLRIELEPVAGEMQ